MPPQFHPNQNILPIRIKYCFISSLSVMRSCQWGYQEMETGANK